MRNLFEKIKALIPVGIYLVVYLVWFFLLESHVTTYRIIHTSIDDKIPFCEFFVIPYYTWFAYVALVVVFMAFTDLEEYKKTVVFLLTGMTIFLIISTLWPNGQNLRPLVMPRDNFCSRLVQKIYSADTPTNLWPSIHVYNSIGTHIGVCHNRFNKNKRWIKNCSLVLCVLICLSTMFIKQHSLFDVSTALLMALLMAIIVYRKEIQEAVLRSRERHAIRMAFNK